VQKKTLWIAALGVVLHPFYAADEKEAKEQAARLERENNARCHDLRSFPFGFRVHYSELPGTISVEAEGVK
jgi:hypothetical protein